MPIKELTLMSFVKHLLQLDYLKSLEITVVEEIMILKLEEVHKEVLILKDHLL